VILDREVFLGSAWFWSIALLLLRSWYSVLVMFTQSRRVDAIIVRFPYCGLAGCISGGLSFLGKCRGTLMQLHLLVFYSLPTRPPRAACRCYQHKQLYFDVRCSQEKHPVPYKM
jgi:hypothetical protein